MEIQYARVRGNIYVDGSGNFYFKADQEYHGPFGTLAEAGEFASTISTVICVGYSLSLSGVGKDGTLDVYREDEYYGGRIATLELDEIKSLVEELNTHINKWEKQNGN